MVQLYHMLLNVKLTSQINKSALLITLREKDEAEKVLPVLPCPRVQVHQGNPLAGWTTSTAR